MNTPNMEQLAEQVHLALTFWHGGSNSGSPLQEWLLFQRTYRQCRDVRRATNRVLLDGLDQLAREPGQDAVILRMRFADEQPAQEMANRLNLSVGNIYKKQRSAIVRLTQILWEQEEGIQNQIQSTLRQRLDSPGPEQLFGVEPLLQELAQILVQPGPPWILCVEGIGGIGKTSLVHALVQRLIQDGTVGWRDFDDLAWITVRTQDQPFPLFPTGVQHPQVSLEQLLYALAAQLLGQDEIALSGPEQIRQSLTHHVHELPHLIVVDNLERQSDVEAVLAMAQGLTNPSKVVLTSRYSPLEADGVYHFHLPELTQPDALALVRHEAALRHLPDLAQAADEVLAPIYATVGGNPLALRLIVGQTFVYSLPEVLASLKTAQGGAVENLYTFIYRQAWENLDEDSRRVLLIMPLIGEQGADLDYLLQFAEQEPCAVRRAINHLVQRNLVDSRGNLHQRRYAIHSLTRSFLHEQVLKWTL